MRGWRSQPPPPPPQHATPIPGCRRLPLPARDRRHRACRRSRRHRRGPQRDHCCAHRSGPRARHPSAGRRVDRRPGHPQRRARGSPRAHRPDPPHGLRDPQSAQRSDRDPARAAHRRKRRRRPPGRIPRRHRRGPLRPASPPEGRPPPAPDRHPPARRGGRWRRERRTRAGRGRYRGRHGPSRRRPHRRRRRRRHRPRCPGHSSSRAPTVTSCPSVVTQNLVITGTVVAVLVTIDFIGHLPLPLGALGHEGSTAIVGLNGLRLRSPRAWR